jgi:cytochrome c
MIRRLAVVAAVLLIAFAAAQLIRPNLVNPPIAAGRTIQAQVGTANGLAAVLDRACGDCHSNATVWPSYARIAPLSWLMAYGVAQGRKAVNFSEWTAYSPERQRQLMAMACRDVSTGKMPGSLWTTLHPEARLSARDVETICAAARQAGAENAGKP